MSTINGGFPELPHGFTVYQIAVKDVQTGHVESFTKVALLNEAKDASNGPDDAIGKVMEDLMPVADFDGDTEERCYQFYDRYRILHVRPELASAA